MDVLIGADLGYTNNPIGLGRQFAGQICEVAFFTSALTAAQVQCLYTAVVALPASALNLSIQCVGSQHVTNLALRRCALP